MVDASQDIIRVVEGTHCAKGPKDCKECAEQGMTKKLCLIRIFEKAGDIPRPVIELERDGETLCFVYDILECFDSIQQAHDYAEEHEIEDIEY